VAANKHDWLALLLQTAARVPSCGRRTARARVGCLARHCHVDPATLFRALAREGLPDWSTLDKLERYAEVPLLRSLVALGRIGATELAAALGEQVPAEGLSPLQRSWQDVISAWPPDQVRFFVDL